MRAWVRRRIDAAHARTVQLRSGAGTVTLSTTLNPLKASQLDRDFVAGLAAIMDRYEQPESDAAFIERKFAEFQAKAAGDGGRS